jgi:hypothetical protein
MLLKSICWKEFDKKKGILQSIQRPEWKYMDANSAVNFQEIYCQQQAAEQRRACCVLPRDIILPEKKGLESSWLVALC